MEKKTVLLLGATGLVGGHVLTHLLNNEYCGRVVTLTRSPIRKHAEAFSKLDARIVDFRQPGQLADQVVADQTFCALGTTIKKAGSREAFRRVDFEYPLTIARAALGGGCRHFLLVSAMGADPHSRVFYNRVKGQLEAAILGLGSTGSAFSGHPCCWGIVGSFAPVRRPVRCWDGGSVSPSPDVIGPSMPALWPPPWCG
jgi:uncharacterized protein YbjT (DUF2867 family)